MPLPVRFSVTAAASAASRLVNSGTIVGRPAQEVKAMPPTSRPTRASAVMTFWPLVKPRSRAFTEALNCEIWTGIRPASS